MAAIVIDSPRWRDGWGEPQREGAPAATPVLRLVGSGTRRPHPDIVRRRRLVVAVLLGLVLVLALGVASIALTRPATAGAIPAGRQTHVVQSGETYWSIAGKHNHGGDLRIAVNQLIDANGARPLFPGDRIELP